MQEDSPTVKTFVIPFLSSVLYRDAHEGTTPGGLLQKVSGNPDDGIENSRPVWNFAMLECLFQNETLDIVSFELLSPVMPSSSTEGPPVEEEGSAPLQAEFEAKDFDVVYEREALGGSADRSAPFPQQFSGGMANSSADQLLDMSASLRDVFAHVFAQLQLVVQVEPSFFPSRLRIAGVNVGESEEGVEHSQQWLHCVFRSGRESNRPPCDVPPARWKGNTVPCLTAGRTTFGAPACGPDMIKELTKLFGPDVSADAIVLETQAVPQQLQNKLVTVQELETRQAQLQQLLTPDLSSSTARQGGVVGFAGQASEHCEALELLSLFLGATACGKGGRVRSVDPRNAQSERFDFEGVRYVVSCVAAAAEYAGKVPSSPAHVEYVREEMENMQRAFYLREDAIRNGKISPVAHQHHSRRHMFSPSVAHLRTLNEHQLKPRKMQNGSSICSGGVVISEEGSGGAPIGERARRRLRVQLLAAKQYCFDNLAVAETTLAKLSKFHNDLDLFDREEEVLQHNRLLLGMSQEFDVQRTNISEPGRRRSSTTEATIRLTEIAHSGIEEFLRSSRIVPRRTSSGLGDSSSGGVRLHLHRDRLLQAQADLAVLSSLRAEAQYLGLGLKSAPGASTLVDGITKSLNFLPAEKILAMFGERRTHHDTPQTLAEGIRKDLGSVLVQSPEAGRLAVPPRTIVFALQMKAEALRARSQEHDALNAKKREVRKKRKMLEPIFR